MNKTIKKKLILLEDKINNHGIIKHRLYKTWANKFTQARNKKLLYSNNKTGFRGVIKRKENIYESNISIKSKKIYLGSFKTDIEAAKAYDNYVIDNGLEHTLNFKRGATNESEF